MLKEMTEETSQIAKEMIKVEVNETTQYINQVGAPMIKKMVLRNPNNNSKGYKKDLTIIKLRMSLYTSFQLSTTLTQVSSFHIFSTA